MIYKQGNRSMNEANSLCSRLVAQLTFGTFHFSSTSVPHMEGTIPTALYFPIQILTPHPCAPIQIQTPQLVTEILIPNSYCLDSLCYCTDSNTPSFAIIEIPTPC